MSLKSAVIGFQYSERIKSELIIAAKLLEEMTILKEDELTGALKLMNLFYDALLVEVGIARNATNSDRFSKAENAILQAVDSTSLHEFSDAERRLSEAISETTTYGQEVTQVLVENGIF